MNILGTWEGCMTCELGGDHEETVYNGQFGEIYPMSGERFTVYNLHVSSVFYASI